MQDRYYLGLQFILCQHTCAPGADHVLLHLRELRPELHLSCPGTLVLCGGGPGDVDDDVV